MNALPWIAIYLALGFIVCSAFADSKRGKAYIFDLPLWVEFVIWLLWPVMVPVLWLVAPRES